MRDRVFDRMQRAFPLERTSAPAVIVAVDEESLRRYGQWPWPRARLADLLDRIDAMHPAAVAFDMFFPEPDRYSPGAIARAMSLPPPVAALLEALASSDARFAGAMRGRPVVLGIAASREIDPRFAGAPRAAPVVVAPGAGRDLADYRGHLASIPMLDAAASGHGLMNSGAADEVVRRLPIVARVQEAIVPTLAVEGLRLANDAGIALSRGGSGTIEMRLAGASFPLQDDGTAWLRFAPHDPARFVSAADVLDGKVDPARFQSKLVLVGLDAVGLQDYRTTPLGDVVPGVEIHAQVAENVFDGVSLVRPGWAGFAEVAVLLAAAIAIVVLVPRLTALQGLNAVVLLVLLIVGASLVAFVRAGLLVDPAWPSIGVIAVYVTVVVGSLSEAERQRRVLREQAARLAGEMDAARRIQMGLLPDPREAAGGDRRVRIAALLEPARTVGGDFYDCFPLDAGRIFIAVADVSGKGLPAALFMASVKSQLKAEALRGGSVGEILGRTEARIAHENPEHLFVTVFAGVLDLATGILEHANAGHEAPFAHPPGAAPARIAASGGPPLGVIEGYAYPTGRHTLAPGEWICVVSDGVTEAMNRNREFFTADRLRATLARLGDRADPEAIVQRVRDDVDRFADGAERADDLTLLALRWEGA